MSIQREVSLVYESDYEYETFKEKYECLILHWYIHIY